LKFKNAVIVGIVEEADAKWSHLEGEASIWSLHLSRKYRTIREEIGYRGE